MIQSYFSKVKAKLNILRFIIKSEIIKFDMVSPDLGILKGKFIFIDGSILEFRELVSPKEHDYRFQWMDKEMKLINRWDTAPHHKKLDNFPYHLHLKNSIVSSSEVNLIEVLETIKIFVIRKMSEL